MAQNVLINGVTYQSVPEVDIPKSTGGTAKVYDTAGADFTAADLRNGKKGFGASGEITGSMTEKSAASYNPSTSDQTIGASQYLSGAQTIKAVTVSNLSAQYIVRVVRMKVGCSGYDVCSAACTWWLVCVVVSQGSTTNILSFS